MSLSTYTLDWFDVARKDLHIQYGLQSVGETQFGTIYWSLDSVVQGIPAFTKIVRNPGLGIDNTVSLIDNLILEHVHSECINLSLDASHLV
jgi:hypothetical protein